MDASLFRFIWRHSRRDQLLILSIILVSLPFYWASLDIPKRIVNDALQGRAFKDGARTARLFDWSIQLPDFLGGSRFVLSPGFDFGQIDYLLALSLFFLMFVVINGAFKYAINILKGVLGERMLRRMRFGLFSTLLRFRPEDIRSVKPAEAASMIKDEVEPTGGFVGDAFIQPAFLGTQALTALMFIMMQSFWLGLVALTVILLQAFVIPRLRRRQLELTRERQIASRKLAGRVGEIVEGAPAVHIHGTAAYNEAEIGSRLGQLFDIRVDLFRRKFAVKYLNNFLAQITPFFFYAIGGYFALKGQLDLGQLVACIGAYRDLPPPIKELIDWDQERLDVTIKYQQIVSQFSADRLMPVEADEAGELPPPDAPIAIDGLRVVDRRGSALLESLTVSIPRPRHTALVGASGSGRDVLAKVLGRQITEVQGSVRIGRRNLLAMPAAVASRLVAYAGSEPTLFSGSIRDNVTLSLRRHLPDVGEADGAGEQRRRVEARRSGNPIATPDDDWFDYAAAGVADAAGLDRAVLEALSTTGLAEEVYKFGLLGRLSTANGPDTAARFIAARKAIQASLGEKGLTRLVEPFDPAAFNQNATIGENLLFGVPVGDRLAHTNLAADSYCRAILEAEALIEPLSEIGLRIAETTIDTFKDLPPGHPLFERYALIRADEMEEYQRIVETVHARDSRVRLPSASRHKLIALALSYVEPRHRLGLVTRAFTDRVIRARKSLRAHLPQEYAASVEFYDPDAIMRAATVRDNLLFGRITFGQMNAERRVWEIVRETLRALDLEHVVFGIGLDYEVGPGGKLLFAQQRTAINLARCLIKRPEILILDGALSAYGQAEALAMLARIRESMAGRSIIATVSEPSETRGFDVVLAFDGVRLVHRPAAGPVSGNDATLEPASGAPTVH